MNLISRHKIFPILSSFIFCTLIYSQQIQAKSSVWQVSKGNEKIYIAGTVHLLPPSEFPLPKEFEQAYQKADSIMLEAPMPNNDGGQTQMLMLNKMSYPSGQTLAQNLSKNTYQLLADYLAEFGLDIAQYNHFKPSFISLLMLTVEAKVAKLHGEGVDAYFAKKAEKDNKKQQYLETVDFQLSLLADIGQGYEDEFIRANIKQMADFPQLMKTTLAAWRAGDMQKLDQEINQPMLKEDKKSYQTLFINRNQQWLGKLIALFEQPGTELVLVGAGHLSGKGNILLLLKEQGYQVQQIN